MARNVYLGADLIPLAAAPDQRHVRAGRRAALPDRRDQRLPDARQGLAAEIRKAKPDLIGVQEAAIWRRGADGVKDGSTTPATQVDLRLDQGAAEGAQGGRVAATRRSRAATGSTSRRRPRSTTTSALTQRDVILVRKGSKAKLRKTFRGGFHEPLRPADAGRRGAAAARLGRRRRDAGEARGSAS